MIELSIFDVIVVGMGLLEFILVVFVVVLGKMVLYLDVYEGYFFLWVFFYFFQIGDFVIVGGYLFKFFFVFEEELSFIVEEMEYYILELKDVLDLYLNVKLECMDELVFGWLN